MLNRPKSVDLELDSIYYTKSLLFPSEFLKLANRSIAICPVFVGDAACKSPKLKICWKDDGLGDGQKTFENMARQKRIVITSDESCCILSAQILKKNRQIRHTELNVVEVNIKSQGLAT